MKQPVIKILFLFMGLLFILTCKVAGQDIPVEGPTSGTDIFHKAPPKPEREFSSNKNLLQLIEKDTRNILYGNKCFEEFTYQLGFEYVVEPPGEPGSRSNMKRFFHNFGAKFILIFKAGPFWKSRVNKKVRECRALMGDFTG